MSDSCSIIPFQFQGLRAQCAWAPEPVFTLEEATRLLGTTKNNILIHVRQRHPEVKLPPKVLANLGKTFGGSLTEYGEVRLILDSPGGPQDSLCFTLYGLFLHALYLRTKEARRFCRVYPIILEAILTGRLRAPVKIACRYQWTLSAPPRQLTGRVAYVAAESGLSRKTIWDHLAKIRRGCVDRNGMPRRTKPGPPPGRQLARRAGLPVGGA